MVTFPKKQTGGCFKVIGEKVDASHISQHTYSCHTPVITSTLRLLNVALNACLSEVP